MAGIESRPPLGPVQYRANLVDVPGDNFTVVLLDQVPQHVYVSPLALPPVTILVPLPALALKRL